MFQIDFGEDIETCLAIYHWRYSGTINEKTGGSPTFKRGFLHFIEYPGINPRFHFSPYGGRNRKKSVSAPYRRRKVVKYVSSPSRGGKERNGWKKKKKKFNERKTGSTTPLRKNMPHVHETRTKNEVLLTRRKKIGFLRFRFQNKKKLKFFWTKTVTFVLWKCYFCDISQKKGIFFIFFRFFCDIFFCARAPLQHKETRILQTCIRLDTSFCPETRH